MSGNEKSNHLALTVIGIVLAAVSALLLWHMRADPAIMQPRGRDPGPAFQPGITLALMGVGGIVLAISAFRQFLRGGGLVPGSCSLSREAVRLAVPAAMVISLILLVWLVRPFGFLGTSIVFSACWALWMSIQDRPAGWLQHFVAVAGGAAAAVVLYILFNLVIGIPL